MGQRDQFIPSLSQLPTAHAVKFAGENQVFVRGQFVVERKLLRHVTDHLFDLFAFTNDVAAADARGAFGRFENSAKHANDGRFPGAVRPEKAEDGTFADRKRNVIDGGECTETFR